MGEGETREGLKGRGLVIYEVNTLIWLRELGERRGRRVTLADVSAGDWDELVPAGVDALWLMGVWERSPLGREIALGDGSLRSRLEEVLGGLEEGDVVASPYCVRRYDVDPDLGGNEGLAAARDALKDRGVRLILDFVPNHLAPDSPLLDEDPRCFLPGDEGDLQRDPAAFLATPRGVFARGRDPHYPPWPDVLQLNAFSPHWRRRAASLLSGMTALCDGLRCDMAHLLLNRVFAETWGERAGHGPARDFWEEVLPPLKAARPDFLLIAEAYGGWEETLLDQGFSLAYDKPLYDALAAGDPWWFRDRLAAVAARQEGLLRFLENHDEQRAAALFPPERLRAAAILAYTLPGSRLFHEGQFTGRKVRLPVFLGRRPPEPPDGGLEAFYGRLVDLVSSLPPDASWSLCPVRGWPDNDSWRNITAWAWDSPPRRLWVIVNYTARPSQALVTWPWGGLGGRSWVLRDPLTGARYERDGDEMDACGLFVDLGPWSFHVFTVTPASGGAPQPDRPFL
ncbi:MAG TPA: alpha-amylase family glycosyl hydrolase [Syntrophales bacterium]|nr:alpha-amylase family glycosyl hydrolase [Syntrophales bacterium]